MIKNAIPLIPVVLIHRGGRLKGYQLTEVYLGKPAVKWE